MKEFIPAIPKYLIDIGLKNGTIEKTNEEDIYNYYGYKIREDKKLPENCIFNKGE